MWFTCLTMPAGKSWVTFTHPLPVLIATTLSVKTGLVTTRVNYYKYMIKYIRHEIRFKW